MRRFLPTIMLPLLLVLAMPSPAQAAIPAGFSHFHTYPQVRALLDAAEADHPGIARVFSIGRSHQNRPIWAIKISDNVGVDENEPEVLIDAQIHARERATNELALYMVQLLTDRYGQQTTLGQRVTNIVNTREIWIIPTLNPDGAQFDISGGQWHEWRRNRQPIPDSKTIGVDLNRQFGYKWGCCGGSSGKPGAWNYRGPEPWWAPEVRAYRNFVNDRVVGGEQQIRVIVSLHSAGRLVLWPYSYTKQDIPPEMPVDDHTAFVAFGTEMARLNDYRPRQASDLYIVDGDANDWAYYAHGIFAFTFEMLRGETNRYYPSASEIRHDLLRNRPAMLHMIENADCPYRDAGLEAEHC